MEDLLFIAMIILYMIRVMWKLKTRPYIIIVALAVMTLSSCGSHYYTTEAFIPGDSIIYRNDSKIAFFYEGRISQRNTKYITDLDSVGVIVTIQKRR